MYHCLESQVSERWSFFLNRTTKTSTLLSNHCMICPIGISHSLPIYFQNLLTFYLFPEFQILPISTTHHDTTYIHQFLPGYETKWELQTVGLLWCTEKLLCSLFSVSVIGVVVVNSISSNSLLVSGRYPLSLDVSGRFPLNLGFFYQRTNTCNTSQQRNYLYMHYQHINNHSISITMRNVTAHQCVLIYALST